MTLRQSLYTLATVVGLSISGCLDNPGVDPDTPADLLAVGKCAHGDYAFFETPNDLGCRDYRLHVKTPQGTNLVLRDYCTNKSIDSFPGDFLTKKQAQVFYDACVPEQYRSTAQPATPVEVH